MRFDRDGAKLLARAFHNQYGLLMAMSTVEGFKRFDPDARPFILSRAGFAGIQRVAAQWLGDNYSDWDHLFMSLPMATGSASRASPHRRRHSGLRRRAESGDGRALVPVRHPHAVLTLPRHHGRARQ